MDSPALVSPPAVGRPLRLLPFLGWRLAPGRVGDPATARLFARPYRSSAARLDHWRSRGELVADRTPAIYVHEYTAAGLTVRGLVGALDLSHRAESLSDRAVVPHEGIHPDQVTELADRMSAGGVNPAPILLVHRGSGRVRELIERAVRGAPDQEYVDRADQRHRIWPLRDPADHALVDADLAASCGLIADGHHRYAAYLSMQSETPGGPADRGLAMLVDQDDTPLFLGAIHRVLLGRTLEGLQSACARAVGPSAPRFTPLAPEHPLAALRSDTLVATNGRDWAAVTLSLPPDRAAVEALHEDLLPALRSRPRRSGSGQGPAGQRSGQERTGQEATGQEARGVGRSPGRISYHHSVEEALAKVRRTRGVALLMPAADYDQVAAIAMAGRLLPEKATSFQPKPSVGSLIRFLADG